VNESSSSPSRPMGRKDIQCSDSICSWRHGSDQLRERSNRRTSEAWLAFCGERLALGHQFD